MISLFFENPLVFLIIFPSLLMSIVFHEFAHSWVTDRLGDPTPRAKGRLTLDPRAHLDPLGVLALLFTRFGWGKPAPFDPYNLKNPVRDTALIAAAGPLSNLSIATIAAMILKLSLLSPTGWLGQALGYIVVINIVLAVFNLLPIYPLDGSKILLAWLPSQSAIEYEHFMNRYGIMVLVLLLFPWGGGVSPVWQLLGPVVNFLAALLIG